MEPRSAYLLPRANPRHAVTGLFSNNIVYRRRSERISHAGTGISSTNRSTSVSTA